MAKYRKVALIDAEQFTYPEKVDPRSPWADVAHNPLPAGVQWAPDADGLLVAVLDTMEGRHQLRRNDWIATGPQGERWNIADSVFRGSYERVDA